MYLQVYVTKGKPTAVNHKTILSMGLDAISLETKILMIMAGFTLLITCLTEMALMASLFTRQTVQ